MRFIRNLCGLACLGALAAPQWLSGAFIDLGGRLPADTNAMVAVNLEKVMASPLAQKEQWPKKWSDAFAAGPALFPPGTVRALVGARMMPNMRESKWQISMMDLTKPIPLQEIARSEGGYTDKLWDKVAVVAPTNSYFVQMSPTLLVGIEPADRPFSIAWVRESSANKGPASPFLQSMTAMLGANTQIVMGMDLTDAFSPSDVRKAIETRPFEALADTKQDLDVLSHTFASIKSVSVDIAIDDAIQAKMKVQFDMDAAPFETVGKPLFLEILGRAGMSIEDMKEWKPIVSGKEFRLEGPLTTKGLREVLSVIGMTAPAYSEDATLTTASDDPAVIAQASKRYFQAISNAIDAFPKDSSYAESRAWMMREAQVIDRLPLINVDPELTDWGTQVSSKMRQVGSMLASDQQTAMAKVQGVANSQGSYYVGYDGGYRDSYRSGYYGPNSNVKANQDWQRQRTQAMTEQKAQTMKDVTAMVGTLGADRGKIRASMTAKYKVEF